MITARSAAPAQPSGHGTVAPGSEADVRATSAIHPVATPAGQATTCAAGSHTAASTVTTTPSTVAGATAGAASRLAGTDISGSSGLSSTTTGPQTNWAAAGMAMACAATSGIHRDSAAAIGRASSSSAPVASTDSTKA